MTKSTFGSMDQVNVNHTELLLDKYDFFSLIDKYKEEEKEQANMSNSQFQDIQFKRVLAEFTPQFNQYEKEFVQEQIDMDYKNLVSKERLFERNLIKVDASIEPGSKQSAATTNRKSGTVLLNNSYFKIQASSVNSNELKQTISMFNSNRECLWYKNKLLTKQVFIQNDNLYLQNFEQQSINKIKKSFSNNFKQLLNKTYDFQIFLEYEEELSRSKTNNFNQELRMIIRKLEKQMRDKFRKREYLIRGKSERASRFSTDYEFNKSDSVQSIKTTNNNENSFRDIVNNKKFYSLQQMIDQKEFEKQQKKIYFIFPIIDYFGKVQDNAILQDIKVDEIKANFNRLFKNLNEIKPSKLSLTNIFLQRGKKKMFNLEASKEDQELENCDNFQERYDNLIQSRELYFQFDFETTQEKLIRYNFNEQFECEQQKLLTVPNEIIIIQALEPKLLSFISDLMLIQRFPKIPPMFYNQVYLAYKNNYYEEQNLIQKIKVTHNNLGIDMQEYQQLFKAYSIFQKKNKYVSLFEQRNINLKDKLHNKQIYDQLNKNLFKIELELEKLKKNSHKNNEDHIILPSAKAFGLTKSLQKSRKLQTTHLDLKLIGKNLNIKKSYINSFPKVQYMDKLIKYQSECIQPVLNVNQSLEIIVPQQMLIWKNQKKIKIHINEILQNIEIFSEGLKVIEEKISEDSIKTDKSFEQIHFGKLSKKQNVWEEKLTNTLKDFENKTKAKKQLSSRKNSNIKLDELRYKAIGSKKFYDNMKLKSSSSKLSNSGSQHQHRISLTNKKEQNLFLVVSDDEMSEKDKDNEQDAIQSDSFDLEELLIQEIENGREFSFESLNTPTKQKTKSTEQERLLKQLQLQIIKQMQMHKQKMQKQQQQEISKFDSQKQNSKKFIKYSQLKFKQQQTPQSSIQVALTKGLTSIKTGSPHIFSNQSSIKASQQLTEKQTLISSQKKSRSPNAISKLLSNNLEQRSRFGSQFLLQNSFRQAPYESQRSNISQQKANQSVLKQSETLIWKKHNEQPNMQKFNSQVQFDSSSERSLNKSKLYLENQFQKDFNQNFGKQLYQDLKQKKTKFLRQTLVKLRINSMHDIGEIVDENQNTMLIIASQQGDYETTKALLELGFPVNAQNKDGNTALHFAKENKYWKIVDLLIENGADEQIQNYHGKIPWEGLF